MTYVSTPRGAVGSGRTRRFGPIVAAVAIVVAAGAAIATGFALSEPEATTTATESIYGNVEVLRLDSPSAQAAARADQVHRGRAPALAGSSLDTSTTAGQQSFVDELVRQGRIPAGAIPTGAAPFYESPGTPR